MKYTLIGCFLMLIVSTGFSQNNHPAEASIHKGRMYFYWGWNWGWYSKSNITFSGENYNFTLEKVKAKDRQSEFSLDAYFNPSNITIPQYNFRLGYYLNEKWDISFGIDHMKYVVQQNQEVKINGRINATHPAYDGVYTNEDITLTGNFLKFEHTDGLNYINIEVCHTDEIYTLGKINVSLKEGLGIGLLVPRTNTTLLSQERHDEFHLSGYGINSMVGVNVSFLNKFFIQTELKGGFINMPDIRTTHFESDKASQHFFFSQLNIVFGGIINTKHKI